MASHPTVNNEYNVLVMLLTCIKQPIGTLKLLETPSSSSLLEVCTVVGVRGSIGFHTLHFIGAFGTFFLLNR
jgi:hypothetical protein